MQAGGGASPAYEGREMAKGQRRSTREVKKPKKEKAPDSASPVSKGSSWLTVEKLEAREAEAKRRR